MQRISFSNCRTAVVLAPDSRESMWLGVGADDVQKNAEISIEIPASQGGNARRRPPIRQLIVADAAGGARNTSREYDRTSTRIFEKPR
jgi:hypothetical protein